jgi:aconitate hydratase
VTDFPDIRRKFEVAGTEYIFFSLPAAEEVLGDLSRVPRSLRVLLENMLRHLNDPDAEMAALKAVAGGSAGAEINFRPVRILMQDFTGVPAVADLAAMRDAMVELGGNPKRISPLAPVDLVIDHSVMVDQFGHGGALGSNTRLEMERNKERYEFLRWGQAAFDNFRVVPPGTGICHQVNLEHLAQVVWTSEIGGQKYAFPDTVVGTDSHTTMINGLSVLGWGVGGIEAEAVMLGQPVSMLIPEVVGFELTGGLPEGATATDLVLRVVEMLRARGVVGKFVEFFGPGIAELSLADRATIANMAPEYGATCGFFPIDQETIKYMTLSGRDETRIALVEAYAKVQGLWRDDTSPEPEFTDVLRLDIATVTPSLAGPKRPQDRVDLSSAAGGFRDVVTDAGHDVDRPGVPVQGQEFDLSDGHIVIAAITSCTNTSNPSVMMAAGLVAANAVERGLTVKPWVKTSLAPGSQVVSDYLAKAGLQDPLDSLGFNVVGYGCTTCIGNSGPLDPAITAAIQDGDVVAASVLSGNRNFEGRVNPDTRANYLASPPLVVAYAIAGTMTLDLATEPLGKDGDGNDVYLSDLWPTNSEISDAIAKSVTPEMFRTRYADAFAGSPEWQAIPVDQGLSYGWADQSTYVRRPPFFDGMRREPTAPQDISGARVLALLGDSITTDHISPAGSFKADSPAGAYLTGQGVDQKDFNSFGARRGNHEVMMRGTFGNIRIRNEMARGTEGGVTRHMPDGAEMPIFDAAMAYQNDEVPLVVIAGKEYGTGSSRDWAAKGPRLLGVRAVIAESFERIHRSNLVGLGMLPLEFTGGQTRKSLGLDGSETFNISGISSGLVPGVELPCQIVATNGEVTEISVLCRIDTGIELDYYLHSGVLPYVLRTLLDADEKN